MTVLAAVRDVLAGLGFPVELAMTPASGGGAMVALVPSAADAARLAIDGGEPVDELHLTLFFLGKADTFPADVRAAAVAAVRGMVQRREQGPVTGNAFAASMFNPGGEEPCWVLGVGDLADAPGGRLGQVRELVSEAWADGMVPMPMPEQRTPWAPHITLIYTGDTTMAATVAERTGPVMFDRLRVAFGGEVTDVPLDEPVDTLAAIVRDELARLHLPGRHDQKDHGRPGAIQKLKEKLEQAVKGAFDGDPFEGYGREQLRKVAKARGVELGRGEDRDSIAKKLLDSLTGGADRGGSRNGTAPRAPKPAVEPRTGQAAIDAAPARLDDDNGEAIGWSSSNPGWTVAEMQERFRALSSYRGAEYQPINRVLRGADLEGWANKYSPEHIDQRVKFIDDVMDRSRLTHDVLVVRGTGTGRGTFGDALKGDLTGFEWTEGAYTSTSADPEVAEGFTYKGLTMNIRVPKGVGAVNLSGFDGEAAEAELLLERGLRMRVVADSGPGNPRTLDIEVLDE